MLGWVFGAATVVAGLIWPYLLGGLADRVPGAAKQSAWRPVLGRVLKMPYAPFLLWQFARSVRRR